MTTFSAIQTRVQNRLIDVRTETSNEIPNLINLAMRQLEWLHNFAAMENEAVLNTTVATRVLGSLPTTFKEFRGGNAWYIDQTGAASKVFHRPTLEEVLAEYAFDDTTEVGAPRVILVVPTDTGGGATDENGPTFQVQVWPYPDGNSGYTPSGGALGEYPVHIPYWGLLSDLVLSTDANWFTDNAEDFLVAAACAEGFYMNEDENRGMLWEDRAYGKNFRETSVIGGYAKMAINRDKRRRIGQTNTLIPRRDVFAPRNQMRLS